MQVEHALRSASVLCVGPVFNLHNSCTEKHASLPELIKMTVEGSLNAPGAIFKLYFCYTESVSIPQQGLTHPIS